MESNCDQFDLGDFAGKVESLRIEYALMDPDEIPTLDPFAEQEYLSALAHLELAERCLKKAAMHQARGIASGPGAWANWNWGTSR